jgi:hypothetical protein
MTSALWITGGTKWDLIRMNFVPILSLYFVPPACVTVSFENER